MANIWRHVFTWVLPVMCMVISVIGFASGNLAGVVFLLLAAFIAVVNVKIYKSGYFDK